MQYFSGLAEQDFWDWHKLLHKMLTRQLLDDWTLALAISLLLNLNSSIRIP